MKKNVLVFMVLLISVTLHSQIINDDNPQKGIWDFKPEKIWEIAKAGDTEFGVIAELLVSEYGQFHIYVRDFKLNISHIFEQNGRYLGSFAQQGSEKGEVSRYLNRFLAEDKIVLGTPEKLHFYSEDGVYDTSFENNIFIRFPLIFLNKNEFIYAPNLPQSPVNQKKLKRYNLLSGEDKLILDFSQRQNTVESNSPMPMIMIFGLIPQIRLAEYHNKLIFGRSDQYTLYVSDLEGNMDFSFGLNRKQKKVSKEDKKSHFQGTQIPPERIDSLIEQLPDKMTYFSRITIVDGLIYVYAVDNIARKKKQQAVDIFSDRGKYLYRGVIKFGDDWKFGSPSNLVFYKNGLYVILESGDGRQTLAKYKITCPKITP